MAICHPGGQESIGAANEQSAILAVPTHRDERRLCITIQRADRRGSLWIERLTIEIEGQQNQGMVVNVLTESIFKN